MQHAVLCLSDRCLPMSTPPVFAASARQRALLGQISDMDLRLLHLLSKNSK